MEYDVIELNLWRLKKKEKEKYIIQTSEHIFQICIDCMCTIMYFQKLLLFYYVDMFCEMFYLLHRLAFAEFRCFCASPTLLSVLPNTL